MYHDFGRSFLEIRRISKTRNGWDNYWIFDDSCCNTMSFRRGRHVVGGRWSSLDCLVDFLGQHSQEPRRKNGIIESHSSFQKSSRTTSLHLSYIVKNQTRCFFLYVFSLRFFSTFFLYVFSLLFFWWRGTGIFITLYCIAHVQFIKLFFGDNIWCLGH